MPFWGELSLTVSKMATNKMQMTELSVCTSQVKGEFFFRGDFVQPGTDRTSDGNIRYFEYENDKFEFLSEYKSGDPQRGLAFVPRRGINVALFLILRTYRS